MSSIFGRLSFSLIVGFFSGFIALLALSLTQSFFAIFSMEDFIARFFINEVGEELIKFLSIIFILNILLEERKSEIWGFIYAVLIGAGFGLFEIVLIVISGETFLISSFLILVGIHSLTSLFLGAAIIFRKLKKVWFLPFFFIVIAVLVHVVYNLLALNF